MESKSQARAAVGKGGRDYAERMANAEAWLVDTLAEVGGVNNMGARRAADVFKREKIARPDFAQSRYTFSHGAFLTRDVIRRAAGVES